MPSSSSPSSFDEVVGFVTASGGTGDREIFMLAPGVGIAATGAGAKLNPDVPADDIEGGPALLLLLEPKENVELVAGAGADFGEAEPKEKETGAGAGGKSDWEVSDELTVVLLVFPAVEFCFLV